MSRNGTVTQSADAPMFSVNRGCQGHACLSADAPSRDHEAQDLTSLGIGLLSSHRKTARAGESLLRQRYAFARDDGAQTLVALGGDGFMLHTLHRMLEGECQHLPVFGMNRGTVGFLMHEWRLEGLAERIAARSEEGRVGKRGEAAGG